MKKILITLASAALLFSAGTASAADIKIGIIDMQTIVQKSPQIAAIKESLTKQFKARQDKIMADNKSVQAEIDNFNRNSATMSAAAKSKLQDKIVADKANVQALAIAYQQDVTTAQNQQMQAFMTKLNTAVDQVAKSGKYDLILLKAAVPYASSGLDVTGQVLADLK